MTPERIVTAAKVTSGEKHDGKQLDELVEKSRENGIEVEAVIGDGAYSGSGDRRRCVFGKREPEKSRRRRVSAGSQTKRKREAREPEE